MTFKLSSTAILAFCTIAFTITTQVAIAQADDGSKKVDDDTNEAAIFNSGSTNTLGFHIGVQRSGEATWLMTVKPDASGHAPTGTQQLPDALAKRFFADIQAAIPFTQYPNNGCTKSSSSGYVLLVQYNGQLSPDLTCPKLNAKLMKLVIDANDIEKQLNLSNQMPRHSATK